MRLKVAVLLSVSIIAGILAVYPPAPQKAAAAALPVKRISGTLSASQTWSTSFVYLIDGEVVVPSGKTLTLAAGSTVKFSQFATIRVDQGATLNANGNSTARITLTSYRDDSVGGDSNGDGVSSGSFNDTLSTGIRNNGGVLSLKFASIRNMPYAIESSCTETRSKVTLADNEFYSRVGLRDCDIVGASVLQRNKFEVPAAINDVALKVYGGSVSGIALSGTAQNTFVGSGVSRVVRLESMSVPQATTWNVSAASLAVVHLQNPLQVFGVMSVTGAVIFKHSDGGSVDVKPGGSLSVTGTATARPKFTSFSDDAAGGDSNGDGPSTGNVARYVYAINNSGGVVTVKFAAFEFGTYAVNADCTNGDAKSTVTDSSAKGVVSMQWCEAGIVTLQRNTFDVAGVPNWSAINATNSDVSGISLSGDTQNKFVGSGSNLAFRTSGAFVEAGKAWTVSPSSGAVLIVQNGFKVRGVLTVAAGSIIKYDSGSLEVLAGATVNLNGTAAGPVVMTSAKDDTIKGDTNGDGTSQPSIWDIGHGVYGMTGSQINATSVRIKYAGVGMAIGGTAVINDFVVSHASTGLSVNNGQAQIAGLEASHLQYAVTVNGAESDVNISNGNVHDTEYGVLSGAGVLVYRGKFANVTGKAAQACHWHEQCLVDAAYVDWGRAEGPVHVSGDLICGRVLANPWVSGASTPAGSVWGSNNCDGTPPAVISGVTASQSRFNQRMGEVGMDCGSGFLDACQAIERATACLSAARDVAEEQSPWPLPPATTQDELKVLGEETVDLGSEWLQSREARVANIGHGTALAAGLLDAWETISSINNAYNECAP